MNSWDWKLGGHFANSLKSHGILGDSHETRGSLCRKKVFVRYQCFHAFWYCIRLLWKSRGRHTQRQQIMRKWECATLLVCHTLLSFCLSLSCNSFIFLLFCRFQRMGGETTGMNSRKRKSDMSLRYCSCVSPCGGAQLTSPFEEEYAVCCLCRTKHALPNLHFVGLFIPWTLFLLFY